MAITDNGNSSLHTPVLVPVVIRPVSGGNGAAPLPPPAPAPVPAPVVAPATPWFQYVQSGLLVAVLGFLLWQHTLGKPTPAPGPAPAPTPDTAIVAATKAYLATLPSAYTSTADAIDAGKITDAQGTFASLQSHAQPLANALNSAIKASSDDKGKFTNAPAVSAMLRSVGATLAKGEK